MTAVTSLLPDVVAAARREPDAEALAKAGAANTNSLVPVMQAVGTSGMVL